MKIYPVAQYESGIGRIFVYDPPEKAGFYPCISG